jgi:hypothetical protein
MLAFHCSLVTLGYSFTHCFRIILFTTCPSQMDGDLSPSLGVPVIFKTLLELVTTFVVIDILQYCCFLISSMHYKVSIVSRSCVYSPVGALRTLLYNVGIVGTVFEVL